MTAAPASTNATIAAPAKGARCLGAVVAVSIVLIPAFAEKARAASRHTLGQVVSSSWAAAPDAGPGFVASAAIVVAAHHGLRFKPAPGRAARPAPCTVHQHHVVFVSRIGGLYGP